MKNPLVALLRASAMPLASIAALGASFALLAVPAFAGGVHSLAIASLPYARTPITVDGSLAEWPDIRPVVFNPIDPGLSQATGTAMTTLRKIAPKPQVQACYDDKALYIGIIWSGASPAAAAGAVDVSVAAETFAKVRIATTPGGALSPLVAVPPSDEWKAVDDGPKAAAITAKGVRTEEIAIPWKLVTMSGAPPKSTVRVALSFSWPAYSQEFLKQLPGDVRHDNTHQTFCFLTSRAKLFTDSQYLGQSSDWGTLRFAPGEATPHVEESVSATGLTELPVSRLSSPVAVDGKLRDWPDSRFATATFLPGLLGDCYSARLATAYDDENFYVAVRYNAPGGPLNTKAEATQAGYAGGDCLQIRLNDCTRTVNLCGWFDSAGNKPALTADGNDLKNPYLLAQGASEAFVSDPDGQSYTQEIAIPWRLIHPGGAPAAGDVWKASFQLWWAGLDPAFTALMTPSLERPGGIPFAYTLPAEENVTVAVFDKQGRLLRTLAKDAHRRGGKNVEYWDGRDQFGKPVEPGDYVVKALRHPPIDTQYVMSALNPGTPPWPTSDGRGDWLSDEASAQSAVTDGKIVYLASPGSEKGFAIVAVGPDGKRIWGFQEPQNPRCVSIALGGNNLYALFSGPELTDSSNRFNGHNAIGRAYLICLDKNTGALAGFSLQHARLRVATWPYTDQTTGLFDLRNNKAFTPAAYGGQTRYFANDLGEPTEALGIAALQDKLYVSQFNAGQLLVLDATTGKQIDTIDLPHPVGLHADANNRLLAVSDGRVVAVDPAAKTVRTLIDHDLAAPHDVTTDSRGNIYVSDWKDSFQVKIFSPSCKLLRAIGKPGGRPWIGPWIAGGMLLPRGIAVTNDGHLWVAEDDAAPIRVSVWNTQTGAFERDYLGPTPYGGAGAAWIDPKDPTLLLGEGVFWRIDMAKQTYTPLATAFRRMSRDEAFTPNAQSGPASVTSFEHGGRQYLVISSDYLHVILRRDGLRLTPVAALGCRGRYTTHLGASAAIWDSDIGTHMIPNYYPPFFDGHSGDDFVWCDLNGDGKVQPDEVQWAKTWTRGDKYGPERLPEFAVGWGHGTAPDGTVYMGGFCGNDDVIARFDVQSWTSDGVPIYKLDAGKVVHQDGTPTSPQGLYATASGKVIVSRPYEWGRYKTALDAFSLTGEPLWSIAMPADHQQADDIESDQIVGEIRTKGAGTLLTTWLWHGNYRTYLVTEDGLYVCTLLDDTLLGPKANWGESFRRSYQAPNGDAYLINGANDAYHILKIANLDSITRFGGSIQVTAKDLEAAAQAAATPAAPPAVKPIVHVAWSSSAPESVDKLGNAVTLGEGQRSARVALARDESNLYATFDVHGAKFVNKGSNWQTLFISGDCVDIMLATAPDGAAHYKAAEGDERLVLSMSQGKPIAVLYRPVVPGGATPVRLMAATIDEIKRIDDAHISVEPTDGGYVLKASIPLADLGIDPKSTAMLRGDVGVIFADATGSNRVLRLYYYNQHTEIVDDLTTEATLQPGEWGNVELALGENLVKNGDFNIPLATKSESGWSVREARNGMEVSIDDACGYSGSNSLLVRQTEPIVFADDAYKMPDYEAYMKSANGGKGGGSCAIVQQIPVTAGKLYHLRLHYRSTGFGPEIKAIQKNRGYSGMLVWIYWVGAKSNGATWVANIMADPITPWSTIFDTRFPNDDLARPYKAPDGATSASVTIYVNACKPDVQPAVHIDDIEFVEAR